MIIYSQDKSIRLRTDSITCYNIRPDGYSYVVDAIYRMGGVAQEAPYPLGKYSTAAGAQAAVNDIKTALKAKEKTFVMP